MLSRLIHERGTGWSLRRAVAGIRQFGKGKEGKRMMLTGQMKRMAAVLLAVGLVFAGGGSRLAAGRNNPFGGMPAGQVGRPGLWWEEREGSMKKPAAERISEPEVSGKETEVKEGKGTDTQETGTVFCAAKNYQEILEVLHKGSGLPPWGMNHYFVTDSASGFPDMTVDDAMAIPGAAGEPGLSGGDYSDTNVQVDGIAEADIVKTDGEYIYILSKNDGDCTLYIVRAKDGELALESAFSPEASFDIWQEEMYVSGNRLAVVRYGTKWQEPVKAGDNDVYFDFWFGYYGDYQTEVLVYDITDRKAPSLLGSHTQDGNYVSSREKDGYLYVISEKRIYYNYTQYMDQGQIGKETDLVEEGKAELSADELARLPQVDGGPLSPDCIYFRGDSQDPVYTIVTAVCLETPENPVDSISFMAGSGHCYMSGNAIYLADGSWYGGRGNTDYTDIVKISCADGELGLAAQGKVKGSLDDQFSMDEKDGYLRVVTTVEKYGTVQGREAVWEIGSGRSNALYVLDEKLQVIGSLEGLAEDERIYSARFIGDTAYFVTFRNVDPLFSVDVSDPKHPVLLGALKIPGFSDYLHPYGENLLLGIGYGALETEAVNCVKLTMFDISDPLKVVEKHTVLLEDYWGSEACRNHRSALVDGERNLIGLPLEGSYDGEDGYWNYTEKKGYVVYGYDAEKGFCQKFEKDYMRKWDWEQYFDDANPEIGFDVWDEMLEPWDDWYYMHLRGIYIGDYFYLVNQMKEVCSYRMGEEGFSETARMELR